MNPQLSSRLSLLVWTIALAMLPHSLHAQIRLPSFFSNGMVLQRDSAAPIWGTASPGEPITAELNGQTISTTTDANGDWNVAFKGLAAGGPFTLTIKGGSDTVSLSNVLVGDVWLCSGQSNMTEHMIEIADLAKDDIAAANDPLLHCFTVPLATEFAPVASIAGTWESTNHDTVKGYSALAYYFAKELREQLKVPIGIIHCSYPGTCAEAWMRREAFASLGTAEQEDALVQAWKTADEKTITFLSNLNSWETTLGRQDPGNKGYAQGWADPRTEISTDTTDWKSIPSFGDWSTLGLASGGVIWVRKSIDIPEETAGQDLTMTIADLRNVGKEFGNLLGTVYFNNKPVGTIGDVLKHTFTSPDPVVIKLPAKEVTAGNAVIAIRFFTQEAKAPWSETKIYFTASDSKKHSPPAVTGDWLARVEARLPAAPPDAARTRPAPPAIPILMQVPYTTYNGMLSPLIGYGIKGVLWYQGAANADHAQAYTKLMSALIADWRSLWKQGDFPFYIVQLANCYAVSDNPGSKSPWAAVREAQLQIAQKVPNSGLVVTIDEGEANNPHYHKLKPVGHRSALLALAEAYGRKIEFSGPVYDSMTLEGDKIRLKFTHVSGGLVAKNGDLKRFAIAGKDHTFVWGTAVIDGDTVLVSSPKVAQPVAVRYAWADNPEGCNLYNTDDLPASPFRTDNWPLH
jgi:sialate O-acetylesterase